MKQTRNKNNYIGNVIEVSNNKKGGVMWVKFDDNLYWGYKEQLNEYISKISK
jgi:hypothetical protein